MTLNLIKPPALKAGDTVAAVSLSWGGAGDPEFLWRYRQGVEQLEQAYGLKVIEMPGTLAGSAVLYQHPEKRAGDLMAAFLNPDIKGIFSCIGGNESIRMLPYIDFDIIRRNPKVFLGYSDTTISHLICMKAGITSFYGPSILAEFAENTGILPYTADQVRKALFETVPQGDIPCPGQWTSEYLPWLIENKATARMFQPNTGYELLQGTGAVSGRLMGGCIEVLEMAKQTALWPGDSAWEETMLFFETSEDKPDPTYVEYWLRNYGSQGILQRAKGIIWGKPYDNCYYDEYKGAIRKVLKELNLTDLPVLYNVSFGHTAPMTVLPYGALAEIDCTTLRLSILESAVV